MLGEITEKKLDLAISFTRHNMIQDAFILSPTVNVEYAMYYYFLKMDIKLTNILSSIRSINCDIYYLFISIFILAIFYYTLKFIKLSFTKRIYLISDIFFKGIQLVLQHSVKDKTVVKYENKIIKRMSPSCMILFNICITFFFLNYFLASLSNFYIEIDRSNFLDTIDDLAEHPNIYPVLSKLI